MKSTPFQKLPPFLTLLMFLENIPHKRGFRKDCMGYIPDNKSMERHSSTDGVVFFTLTKLIGCVGGVTERKRLWNVVTGSKLF